jgi:hypothetical protein
VLDELVLAMGGAVVEAQGALLGPVQDATLVVRELPAVLLQPLYRALPALQVNRGKGKGAWAWTLANQGFSSWAIVWFTCLARGWQEDGAPGCASYR